MTAVALAPETVDYLRRKWRSDVTDAGTGLSLAELKSESERIVAEWKDREAWCLVKARLFETIVRQMAIGVSRHDFFPAFAVWSRKDRVLTPVIKARTAEIDRTVCTAGVALYKSLQGHILRHDYDHAAPDWDRVLALGFPGLRQAVADSPADNDFAAAMRRAADAMLEGLARLESHARTCADRDAPRVRELAEALAALRMGPPRTTYEVLVFELLFFVYGEHVDHLQVRTLGNLDRLLAPYYAADLAAGRITREKLKEYLAHFFWQWGSIDNWWGQPFYIGGTKADGSTEYNEVSRCILEVLDELALPTPKLQLKMSPNTPDDIWRTALDMARRHRSLVFCGEAPMARCLAAMGFDAETARTCELWGCYEFQPRARANTTLPAVLNFVRVFEDLLAEARKGTFAPATFAEFRRAYLARVARTADLLVEGVRDFEKPMDEIIPALVHSLSIDGCVRTGRNAIGNGMEFNLSVILQTGVGTAADALAAVEEVVYARREMTLKALAQAMAANWKGHEKLRLRMQASRRKWGNNEPFTNALVGEMLRVFGSRVNGLPNTRGGRFYASGHSIDYFHILSRWSGATPDGRAAGDEYSKNLSPAPGADREGATALVAGVRAIDTRDIPGDVIFDFTLHPSSVADEKGLLLLRALVEEFFAVHGCAIHFNIFSADELRDAQAHPERYENLQVRVCGWNVRWNDLTRQQQDAYILRCSEVMVP